MNTQVRPAVMREERSSHRERLRSKLALNPWLARREVFRVGREAIHCELYAHGAEAPTILFLPGIGTYCELYAELLGKLSARGFNVVGIDPPGHGYSGGRRGEYRIEGIRQAVSAVLDLLQQRFHGAFGIFGFSIGATLGLAAAEADERLQALLCGTLLLPDLPPDLFHQWGWSWTWAGALFFPGLKMPLRSLVDFDQLLAGHPAGDEINRDPLIVFDYPLGTLSSVFNWRSAVVQRRCGFRSAILHGDRDEVLPLAYSQRVIAGCQHPFELIELPQAGHMVPWLRPDCTVERAADWFGVSLRA